MLAIVLKTTYVKSFYLSEASTIIGKLVQCDEVLCPEPGSVSPTSRALHSARDLCFAFHLPLVQALFWHHVAVM